MISRRHIQAGIFAVLLFASTLIGHRAHAYTILSEPTGTCPDYLAAVTEPSTSTTEAPKISVKKVGMQCIQGMCNRCGLKNDVADTTCSKADAAADKGGFKTDIPCNYSVDDIFVTVLNIVRLIFGITGAVALAVFIWGALYYFILSAGESGKVKQGKSLMVNSIIAIMITFGAGAIVTFAVKAVGGNISQTDKGALGDITFPEAQCPAGGKQGDDCKNNSLSNMTCYYGPDFNGGAVSKIEGQCVSLCQYNASPPYGDDSNDLDPTYQCADKTLLPASQQSTCKTGLCPGAASVQCCKL